MGRKKKKKGDAPPPPAPGGLPPLPLPPLPGAPMVPPAPAPTPPSENAERGALDGASAPTISGLAPPNMAEKPKEDGYDSLWKRGSSKPLQQVYGHIDRLGEGEVGSLLDRYADRFGHSLDREIIVKRKAEHDARLAEVRDAPTITLLGEEDEDDLEFEEEDQFDEESLDEESLEDDEESEAESDEDEPDDESEDVDEEEAEVSELDIDDATLSELESRKKNLESRIRKLKPKYKLAKQRNQTGKLKKLKPQLEELMAEYKSVKAVLSGEAPLESLDEDDSPDQFLDFVSVVDNLLMKLPDVDEFIASSDFPLYAAVAGDAAAADHDKRSEFFALVDSLLLSLPEEEIVAFTRSEDFAIYSAVGAQYGS